MLTTQSPATRRAWNDEDRRQLRALVRQFTSREIVPHIPLWEESGELPPSLHQAAGRLGLLGAEYAEELGSSVDKLDELAVADEMVLAGASLGSARHCSDTRSLRHTSSSLATNGSSTPTCIRRSRAT